MSKTEKAINFNGHRYYVTDEPKVAEAKPPKEASNYGYRYHTYETIYDGEKNPGELGAPIRYEPDYETLRVRSWQAYTESDIAKILVNQMVDWVIGSGLTVQSRPLTNIIESEGYKIDNDSFTTLLEDRFRVWSMLRNSAYDQNGNMHKNARKIAKSIWIGGDCLAVYRYGENVTSQLIDGGHVKSPWDMTEHKKAKNRGNEIIYGVERKAKSKVHVAYWVSEKDGSFRRILARGQKTGRLQATMLYADEYRVDDVRGMPLYAASLEKMKKIDRYVEAMVGSAEERANIPYFFEHNHFSDGEPVLAESIRNANAAGEPKESSGISSEDSAKTVAMTTSKTVNDLPIGVTIKAIESTVELRLKEFTETNFIYICASIGMPYEVALMKYENSFSASRMASQSFMQIINNRRADFAFGFYKPQWDIFLENEILKGKVVANGYFNALLKQDSILLGAYHNAKFVGAGVPQADPSKEVKASLLKLQGMLSTIDQESEILGTGDFATNIQSYSREINKIKEFIPKEWQNAPNAETTSAEFGKEPKANEPK